MTLGATLDGICFNTQPPEGGWSFVLAWTKNPCGFNTQPPEGGWGLEPVRLGQN